MEHETKVAFRYTLGIVYGLCVIFGIGQILSYLISPYLTPVDPTDKDYRHRSNLEYHKDYGTGKEYISTGCGGELRDR